MTCNSQYSIIRICLTGFLVRKYFWFSINSNINLYKSEHWDKIIIYKFIRWYFSIVCYLGYTNVCCLMWPEECLLSLQFIHQQTNIIGFVFPIKKSVITFFLAIVQWIFFKIKEVCFALKNLCLLHVACRLEICHPSVVKYKRR